MVKQPNTTNGAQPSDAAPTYVIGYGRPPVHTRFKHAAAAADRRDSAIYARFSNRRSTSELPSAKGTGPAKSPSAMPSS
jgi:hypothetical protein